jgi:hypothetical protein
MEEVDFIDEEDPSVGRGQQSGLVDHLADTKSLP